MWLACTRSVGALDRPAAHAAQRLPQWQPQTKCSRRVSKVLHICHAKERPKEQYTVPPPAGEEESDWRNLSWAEDRAEQGPDAASPAAEEPAQDALPDDAAFDDSWMLDGQLPTEQGPPQEDPELEAHEQVVDMEEDEPLVEINEDEPRRYPFHRALLLAAKRGDPAHAERLLQEMMQSTGNRLDLQVAPLVPGARAYHALVVAYVRARDMTSALDAVQRAYRAGVEPLEVSYSALIYGYVMRRDLRAAEEVLNSMKSSPLDAYPAWLTLVTLLLNEGHLWEALNQLAEREPHWEPAPQLYLHFLECLCDPASAEGLGLAGWLLQIMLEDGLKPEPEHINMLLKCMLDLQEMGVEDLGAADNVLQGQAVEQAIGQWLDAMLNEDGKMPKPTLESFQLWGKAMLQAGMDAEELHARIMTADELLSLAGMRGDQQWSAILVRAHMRIGDLESAVRVLNVVRASGKLFGFMSCLPSESQAELLYELSSHGKGDRVLALMSAMERDRVHMPREADVQDEAGRTLLTRWLATGARPYKPGRFGGLLATQEAELDLYTEVDGIRIRSNRYVVNEAGAVQPASRLSPEQMQAELKARGLSTAGNKRELYKRVQAARFSDPPDMAADMRKKEVLDERKQATRAVKRAQRKEAERRALRRRTVTVQEWRAGAQVADNTFEVDSDEEEEAAEAEGAAEAADAPDEDKEGVPDKEEQGVPDKEEDDDDSAGISRAGLRTVRDIMDNRVFKPPQSKQGDPESRIMAEMLQLARWVDMPPSDGDIRFLRQEGWTVHISEATK